MNTHLKLTLASALTAAGLGTTAMAGTLADPIVTAPVIAPAPVIAGTDWTGFYGGLQLGYADVDGDAGLLGDDNTYGVHIGYDYDFGNFVVGAELDYDKTDIDLNGGAASIDSVARLKFKGGYDLGNTLIYATAGMARADTSVGNETGPFLGLGLTYRVSDSYSIGAELLEHRFDDVGGTPGADVDATTFNIRASYRF
ncbi:outer membrane protein [Sulfitobacter aestuariivivens]|uniref:Porin family protein n=1 Tax=Sulfitobacter aestuariivivens TaxID=2766981 RepID=A0A927HEJ6_9RHOB|nr:porin family protein [Sulfitobacter aestuariivivens]MBD3663458.1 porin family protein [Sulfitobacter aestuariivivens]